jgi:hypothetical protein
MSDRFEALRQIAPKLNQLHEDPRARVHYELMSDSLVWSDELPPLDQVEPSECMCLRGIWRFRSSLIMGSSEEKFRPAWEEAQKLFPHWPGFLLPRRQMSWRETFIEQRDKLMTNWEGLDARYEQSKMEQKGKPAATA